MLARRSISTTFSLCVPITVTRKFRKDYKLLTESFFSPSKLCKEFVRLTNELFDPVRSFESFRNAYKLIQLLRKYLLSLYS